MEMKRWLLKQKENVYHLGYLALLGQQEGNKEKLEKIEALLSDLEIKQFQKSIYDPINS